MQTVPPGRALSAMTPAEVADLDPGIADTVLWLRRHGFDTCDSGDGKSKYAGDEPIPRTEAGVISILRDPGASIASRVAAAEALLDAAHMGLAVPLAPADWPAGCALPMPNVAITVDPGELAAECDRLRQLIEGTGARVGPIDEAGPAGGGIEIQGSYDPANGRAFIVVTGFALPSGVVPC